jgi:hypothetical protein
VIVLLFCQSGINGATSPIRLLYCTFSEVQVLHQLANTIQIHCIHFLAYTIQIHCIHFLAYTIQIHY